MIHKLDKETNRQAVCTYLQNVMQYILTEQEYEIVMLHCGINAERTPMRFQKIGNRFSLSYKEIKALYQQAIIKTRREIVETGMDSFVCGQYRVYHSKKYVRFRIKENRSIPDWDY